MVLRGLYGITGLKPSFGLPKALPSPLWCDSSSWRLWFRLSSSLPLVVLTFRCSPGVVTVSVDSMNYGYGACRTQGGQVGGDSGRGSPVHAGAGSCTSVGGWEVVWGHTCLTMLGSYSWLCSQGIEPRPAMCVAGALPAVPVLNS